jgi:hypothetical protein
VSSLSIVSDTKTKPKRFDVFQNFLIVSVMFLFTSKTLTLSLAAIKKTIEWRLQVQIAFLTKVNLAPSRPE